MHSPATASILVAHGCPLVAAGLVTVLRRMPGCAVRTWQCEALPDAEIVFGDFEFLSKLMNLDCARGAVSQPKLVLVTDLDADATQDAATLERVDSWLSIQCDEDELFDTVVRLRDHAPPSRAGRPALGGLAPGGLRRVRDAIDERLASGFTLRELAAIAGLSEGHFARAFKQSVGLPPHRYLMRRRVHAAAEMIQRTQTSLSEISLDVGFADQSHFTRTFAREMGETPSAFRHRHR
jgi:AraC-like DNA-binding protein